MSIPWEDKDVWASWDQCNWNGPDPMGWVCLLPEGHSGPHLAPYHMENDPCEPQYVSRDGEWVRPAPDCAHLTCKGTHPGFRHATGNDRTVIMYHPIEDAWGPDNNPHWGEPDVSLARVYVPTFVDTFPAPPKFDTVEEVEAWLEANPP